MRTRVLNRMTPLLAIVLLLATGCASKSPEEIVAERRTEFVAELNGFFIEQEPIATEEADGDAEAATEAAEAAADAGESEMEIADLAPVPVTKKKPYSCDENLLHISFEGGILEDPWKEPDEDMFTFSVSPERAPDKSTYIELDFQGGNPVAIDGEKMSPFELFSRLNKLGGENGIGRLDMVENRSTSNTSEMPAGLVNILSKSEILDLIAYLRAGGDPSDKAFTIETEQASGN